MNRQVAKKAETESFENPPGVLRTTVAYNDQLMMCHFLLKKGALVTIHKHAASQNGYLIRGKLRMIWADGREFIAEPGSGWCFDANEAHGSEAMEESEIVECFAPARPEYVVK